MCGLAGRFHPELLPPAPEWCARADALLAHRGPDGNGVYRDAQCELVHRRLALIDLSATGISPCRTKMRASMWSTTARSTTTASCGRSWRAAATSFAARPIRKSSCISMKIWATAWWSGWRGIFAFALYDRNRRRLLLARDRFGVKPLFYAQHGGQWVFGSEIKAIAAIPGFAPSSTVRRATISWASATCRSRPRGSRTSRRSCRGRSW